MNDWPRHPVIYEVNAWAWLAGQGFDALWFMGVWERSPKGIDISMRNDGLLPGSRLLHEGQFEGWRTRLPVLLGRRPPEANGQWRLCDRSGWPDRALVVVSYGCAPAQARVQVPWDELRSRRWRLDDGLSGEAHERDGNDLRDSGLYVDLAPWQCHVFQVRAL